MSEKHEAFDSRSESRRLPASNICSLHTREYLSGHMYKAEIAAASLRLVPETETTKIGDLLYVRLRYTDKNGTVKPGERGTLNVTVEGGKLLALGSACSYNERGYLTDVTDTYYGEALAIVEAGDGEAVTLSVSDGTRSGKAQIPIRR